MGPAFLFPFHSSSGFPKDHLALLAVVSIESLEQVFQGLGKRVMEGLPPPWYLKVLLPEDVQQSHKPRDMSVEFPYVRVTFCFARLPPSPSYVGIIIDLFWINEHFSWNPKGTLYCFSHFSLGSFSGKLRHLLTCSDISELWRWPCRLIFTPALHDPWLQLRLICSSINEGHVY